jgi:hypothetical protein
MEASTLVERFVEILGDTSEAAAPADLRDSPHDAARSEENVRQWMSYLPEDCVRTMIDMRWDVTT